MPPGTNPQINSQQGWARFTDALGKQVPRYLTVSVNARRGLRSFVRTGR